MTPTVLLLLSKTSYRTSDFLSAAGKLKIGVVVGSDRDDVLAGLSGAGFIFVDFQKPDAAVRLIAEYAKSHPLAAIVPVDEISGPVAARASEILGLVQNPPKAVSTALNKYAFRQLQKRRGLADIDFELIDRNGDIAAMGRRLSYPQVLKPLTLSGSRGVIRVDNDNEFGAAVSRIGHIVDNAGIAADTEARRYILSEDFIRGEEIAIEGLVQAGRLQVLAVFDKPNPLDGPYFEETLYITPSRHPESRVTMAIEKMQQALDGLGIITGAVHGEIRLNQEGAHLIELAPRSIGGLCSRVLELGAGRSLEEIILGQAINKMPTDAEEMKKAAGVMMIPIPARGVLQAVAGIDHAQNIPNVTDITIAIPLGGDVIPLPEGNRYLGFIFAKADNPDATEQALRQAHACLHFDIDQTSS